MTEIKKKDKKKDKFLSVKQRNVLICRISV
jgi:hypothetical protein